MVKKILVLFLLICMISLSLWGEGQASARGAAAPLLLNGQFFVLWGDGAKDAPQSLARYFLTTPNGQQVQLLIEDSLLEQAGGIVRLNRQPVSVTGIWSQPPSSGVGGVMQVQEIALDKTTGGGTEGVFGPQPWVSILCKFSDYPDEPNDLPYFKNMYSAVYPGLDHYWRQQSFDLANVEGSDAFGWYTLPYPRSHYVPPSGYMDWGAAAADCTAAADSYVDFTPFVGINLMFNAVLDCCAWGGGWPLCLDGVCKTWRMTWEPPWGYQNITVIAHETGHGFGLPHSSGDYGQTYDNAWDVMSNAWWPGGAGYVDPTYGDLPQGTISYHKSMLGWIDSDHLYVAGTGTLKTITIERLTMPQTDNFLGAKVLIDDSQNYFYTVEARRAAGYDAHLPGEAIILHHVDVYRENPAHVIDIDGDGDTSDAGAMWLPGETFDDPANGIRITVEEATLTGYVVTIENRYVDLTSVEISGPDQGKVDESLTFTATVAPVDAGLPITYIWQLEGQPPITHTNGITDSVAFSWPDLGSKEVLVTAMNAGSVVSATRTVEIVGASIDGPLESRVGLSDTLTATVNLLDDSQPITYTWEVSGQPPLTHTGGLTDTLTALWTEPGNQLITMTATNGAEVVSATHTVAVNMPLQTLTLSGPDSGAVQMVYTYTAQVEPVNAAQPITYTWQVEGQPPITHTDGVSDSLSLSWESPGMKTITVTAANRTGVLTSVLTTSISIPPLEVTGSGPDVGYARQAESLFYVEINPLTTTLPVTYIWEVDGQQAVTHTGGLTDTLSVAWDKPGVFTVTVTVMNGGGSASYTWEITVYLRVYLPFTVRR